MLPHNGRERRLTHKFNDKLEAAKADHAAELVKLQGKIDSTFDRARRLHDKEFDVLPDIWGELSAAWQTAEVLVSRSRSYPPVKQMGEEELDDYLISLHFSDAQRRVIIHSPDRTQDFIATHEAHRFADAQDKLWEADAALTKSGIFAMPDIHQAMREIVSLLNRVLIEHRENLTSDSRPEIHYHSDRLRSEGAPKFSSIEAAVRERMWDSIKSDSN